MLGGLTRARATGGRARPLPTAAQHGGEGEGGKKKRLQRAHTGDKNNKGLRHFSMKVCNKVEEKMRTTYNEVADELVAEFVPSDGISALDQVRRAR